MLKYFATFLAWLIFSLFPLHAALAEQQKTIAEGQQATQVNQVSSLTPELIAKKVMLNAGTRIPITVFNSVSSNNLKTGDMVGISINKDIYANGQLIFKKGGDGVLFVSESVKSGGHGKPGQLEVNGGRITDVFGNEYPVSLSVSSKGESKRGGAIVATVLGILVILVPFGLWIDG